MEPSFNFFGIINTLGAVQSILIALALFSIKTGNQRANRVLGFFLISLSIVIFDFVLYDTRFFLTMPHLYGIANPFIFLVGPLLLYYAKSLTNPDFQFRPKDFWHFLPCFLFLVLSLPGYFRSADMKRREYLEQVSHSETAIGDYLIIGIINLFIFIYLFATFKILGKAVEERGETPFKSATHHIKWLKNLLIAFLVIQTLSTAFDFLHLEAENWSLTPFLVTIVIYSMSYVGIRQSEIFTEPGLRKMFNKYEKSPLTDEMAEKTLEKLNDLIRKERIYADSALSLPKLARRLAISPYLLSQILNERLNRNFFNFINEQRIEEAKRWLLDPETQQHTILEIAHEVGFNSISAFNSAFRKHTDMSPSEYKKKNNLPGL